MPASDQADDRAAEIARAWERERPGGPVGSIGIVPRIWQAAKLLSDEQRRTLVAAGIDTATFDLLSELTPRGHAEIERVVGSLLGHEQALVDALSPTDQAELARLLAVLLRSLRERT